MPKICVVLFRVIDGGYVFLSHNIIQYTWFSNINTGGVSRHPHLLE